MKLISCAAAVLLVLALPGTTAAQTLSRYVKYETGETTQAMKPGDTYEVEIEGVGVLRNTVVAERR